MFQEVKHKTKLYEQKK